MDFGNVFRIVGQFFIDYCSITVSMFGVSFTVGALFMWCALALILIGFVKGLMS